MKKLKTIEQADTTLFDKIIAETPEEIKFQVKLHILQTIIQQCESIKLIVDDVYRLRQELEGHLTDEQQNELTALIKTRVQQEALTAWGAFLFGAVYLATGAGKSKIGVNIASKFYSVNPKSRGLIVVPTEKLRDENWMEEFSKWGQLNIWENNIERCCYASLNKYEKETFDYVILDEGHNITENNAKFFKQNTVHSCILLTATEPRSQIKTEILKELNLLERYSLSLDESVQLGLVAPYDITIVTMKLDTVDKYIKSGNKQKTFYQTEYAKYKYLCESIFNAPTKQKRLNRMRFIYNLKSKTHAAKLLLENAIPKDIRTLIFCGGIEQADEVCEHSFHSKSKDDSFELFKQLLINRMSCVNSVNEGHNLNEVDCAFIIQLNSNENDLVQRIGRIIRYRPGHRGNIIILCCENTVDKEWVKSATSKLNVAVIRTVELSHLRMGLETLQF